MRAIGGHAVVRFAKRRGSLARSLGAALIAIVVSLPVPVRAGVTLEASDAANRLDQPVHDLALLAPAGPDRAPRLLVVDAVSPGSGRVRVAILQRDRAWLVVAERLLALGREAAGSDPASTPWLVGLGPDRFALLAATGDDETGATTIVGLRTDAGPGRNDLDETGRVTLPVPVDDGGPADVDADGSMELVLATARTTRRGGTCQGSTVRVLDGATLVTRSVFAVPTRRLAGGALGQWDHVPGDDLLAYAYPNCPAGPDAPEDASLTALSLRDGGVIVDLPQVAPDAFALLGAPLRVDLDEAGPHEVLAMSPDGLALLDPADGWRPTPLGSRLSFPAVAAADAGMSGSAVRVAWLDAEGRIGTARLARADDGSVAVEDPLLVGQGELTDDRLEAAAYDAVGSALRQHAATGWLGATVDGGCADLILPGAMLPCGEQSLRAGAAWMGTRPVVALGDGERRRLLVAGGMDLDPTTGYPRTPTPWATGPAGWWRHGPSGVFALGELRAGDVTYYREFPVPRATIERTTAPDGSTAIPGFTGARLFVRVRALAADEPDPPRPQLHDVLDQSTTGTDEIRAARIAVPPGLEAGRDGGFARIGLASTTLPNGQPTGRWWVGVLQVNDWGEMGTPAGGTIIRDAVGPSLVVEAPFTSPVWPFAASLSGSAEPRSVVVVEGIGPVELDRRGRFTIQTPLAPWPQTLRVTATDASSNVTVREVSVVGGIDYRRFPWPVMAAALLLVAVWASGLLGTRARRSGTAAPGGRSMTGGAAGVDAGSLPEMEDLPPGTGLR